MPRDGHSCQSMLALAVCTIMTFKFTHDSQKHEAVKYTSSEIMIAQVFLMPISASSI